MTTKSILLTLLMLAFAWTAVAGDVSGKWTAQVPGRDGQTREQTFQFKQDGDKLTGTASLFQGNELPISDGKVSGDDISFVVKAEFNGNTLQFNYKGKVSGEEIKMTSQREGGQGQVREFTAKKAK
jgi:hypothetical protein